MWYTTLMKLLERNPLQNIALDESHDISNGGLSYHPEFLEMVNRLMKHISLKSVCDSLALP